MKGIIDRNIVKYCYNKGILVVEVMIIYFKIFIIVKKYYNKFYIFIN